MDTSSPAALDCSVIICTHNPRADYLERVLEALKRQTASRQSWELLLIDNASKEPVAGKWDLSWHEQGRHVREDEIGLTPARLRGIRESTGRLLIFVDDDNVLDPDYVATAVKILDAHPAMGSFGASIRAEFETAPPDWLADYREGLVIGELERDLWSNLGGWSIALPYGAGLCVQKCVAEDYAQKSKSNPIRKMLDRSGTGLGAGGDSDLAWCATDRGLGTGRFRALKLTHLIPSRRIAEDYIVRLYAGFASASVILTELRPGVIEKPPAWKEDFRFWRKYFGSSRVGRKIALAQRAARREARQLLRQLQPAKS